MKGVPVYGFTKYPVNRSEHKAVGLRSVQWLKAQYILGNDNLYCTGLSIFKNFLSNTFNRLQYVCIIL